MLLSPETQLVVTYVYIPSGVAEEFLHLLVPNIIISYQEQANSALKETVQATEAFHRVWGCILYMSLRSFENGKCLPVDSRLVVISRILGAHCFGTAEFKHAMPWHKATSWYMLTCVMLRMFKRQVFCDWDS